MFKLHNFELRRQILPKFSNVSLKKVLKTNYVEEGIPLDGGTKMTMQVHTANPIKIKLRESGSLFPTTYEYKM